MFRFWNRSTKESNDGAPGEVVSVALIGEGYRRAYVKNLLGDRVVVAAELTSDRRAEMLSEVSPETVILDYASESVNPLLALQKLAALDGSPRIVTLMDGSVSRRLDEDVLVSLGADAWADIQDSRAVISAVSPTGTEPSLPPHRTPVAA